MFKIVLWAYPDVNPVLVALLGIVLGVSLAGPPGPVTAILVRRASISIIKGALVGFGAMSADLILMILVFLFRSRVDLTAYDSVIYLVGSAFFILLAVLIVRSNEGEPPRKYSSGYLAGLSIGLINPLQIGWWLTAGLGFYTRFGLLPFYFLFIGIVFWVFFLSAVVYRFSTRYGRLVNLGIKIFSFASLLSFGLYFAYLGLESLY